MNFKVVVFNEELVAQNLLRMGRHAANPAPAMDKIVDDMMRVEAAIFSSQGRRYGGSWTALDKDTMHEKLISGENTAILVATGRLRASVTERGHSDQVLEVDGTHIIFGTNRPWAATHQFGSEHVPQRQFIDFNERDAARWANWIREHIGQAILPVPAWPGPR